MTPTGALRIDRRWITINHHFKYFNYIQSCNTHVTPSYATDLLDFMHFINVNILESQRVHSIC